MVMFIFLLTASNSDKHFLLYVLVKGREVCLSKIMVIAYLLLWCSTFPNMKNSINLTRCSASNFAKQALRELT